VAALESDTNKGKSKFGLRPELVEAKERVDTQEKELNGPNAEAQEAAIDIKDRRTEREGEDQKLRDLAEADKHPLDPAALGTAPVADGPKTAGEEQDGFEEGPTNSR
jgi:hypothetical protein